MTKKFKVLVFVGTGALLSVAVPNLLERLNDPTPLRLASPDLLLKSIPLDDVEDLVWSPDARYLAVRGRDSTDETRPSSERAYRIYLISVSERKAVPAINRDYVWIAPDEIDAQTRQWFSEYFNPTPDPVTLPEAQPVGDRDHLAFEPETATLVAFIHNTEDHHFGTRRFFNVRVFRNQVPLFETKFVPRIRGGWSRSPSDFVFSPNKQLLAFSVAGWTGYESAAAGELWLLNLDSHELKLLHKGRYGWAIWDAPMQSVRPHWTPDSRTIVFGDREFGIEQVDVVSGRHTKLLRAGLAGDEPTISPSGRWIATNSVPFERDGIIVSSRDRRWIVHLRDSLQPWLVEEAPRWHPSQDILAFAVFERDLTSAIYLWKMPAEASATPP